MFPAPAAPAKLPEKPWCGGLEIGLVGSDGNSDVFKIRVGGNVKRQTPDNIFTSDVVYGMAQQKGIVSENKALFNVRDEALFKDSPWGLFTAGQLEYDQFRAYDFRLAAHTGFAYQLFKTDATSLRTRVGAGVSYEFADNREVRPGTTHAPDRLVPEGLLGMDFCHKLTDRQRLVGSVDYYPDLSDCRDYRLRMRAAYEILVDPAWGLTLRLGVQDRYDTNPGPAKRNDIDYFATLLLKF
jgi:putative salt-induced outer membrane protein YdiY